MSRSGTRVHSFTVTTLRSLRAVGAALAGMLASMTSPASACSCVPPADLEREGRAALARADLVAELVIDQASFAVNRYCHADGRARLWFGPG